MRRTLTLLALAACAAVVAAVPAGATAHHGQKRHHRISGTVASFSKHTLAIKTSSGKVITAEVTGKTEFECEQNDDGDANDVNDAQDSRVARAAHDGGDEGDKGDDNAAPRPQGAPDDDGDQNQGDDGDEDDNQDGCDDSQLTPGTSVSGVRSPGTSASSASVRGRHHRAVWKKLKVSP